MIYGIKLDKTNPTFSLDLYREMFPQFSNYMDTHSSMFNYYVNIANNKIFKSIWGVDWEYAMGLCISHYIAINIQDQSAPSNTLQGIATSSGAKGILNNYSIKNVYKSVQYDKTMSKNKDALFYNETVYGQRLMTLMETKAIPLFAVITP